MSNKRITWIKSGIKYGSWTIIGAAGLFLLSLHSYLLFHSIAEGFSLIVAFGMFLVAWHTRKYSENDFLLFLGIAYLAVFGIDFIHTLAYKGMGIFSGNSADTATQLWVSARLIQSLSLLAAPYFLTHRLKPRLLITAYLGAAVFILVSIFWLKIFPRCFDQDGGLTVFKKIAEYVIMILLTGAYFNFLKNRSFLDRDTFHLISVSILICVISEASFTFYHDPYSFTNMLGHLLKIIAFFLTYKAIVVGTLEKPFGTLFSSLKTTNERLSVSEEHYRKLFDLSGVGKAEADPVTGRYIRVNRSFCGITGYDENELMKLTYIDLTHPDDRVKDRQTVESVLRGERSSWSTEKRYTRKDGKEIWVSVFGTLMLDADRKPLHTIADIIDITDRREADLKISSLAKFPEEDPFPVMRLDGKGTFLYANRPAASILDKWGCAVGATPRKEGCPRFFKAASENRQTFIEVQHGERWYSLAVVPIHGQEYINVYGRDITDAKSFQEALQISERRYALAQHAANIGTWEWHIPSGRIHWSEEIEPMLGMKPGSFEGTYDSFINCVYPEDRSRVTGAIAGCLENGLDYNVEHRITFPDGTIRWMLESAILLKDEHDAPERMIGVVTDITRQYEEKQELVRTVKTQATVLADTKETLELVSEQKMMAEKQLQKRHKALEEVYAILTSSEASLHDIGDRIVGSIASILDLQSVAFYRLTEGAVPLFVHYGNGKLSHERRNSGPCSACESVFGKNLPFQYTGDLAGIFPDSSCFENGGFRSYIAVPALTFQAEMVGMICAMRREEKAFQDYEVHLIEIFARYVAYEITRRTMQKKMLQSQEMHLLGQLTSGVAHEVRNPLNAIMAISEALFKRIDDNETYGQYMAHIRNQVRRLSRLMEDLLALGRPVRKDDFVSIDICDLLADALADWSRIASDRQQRVHLDIPASLWSLKISADPTKLQQVMVNLLDNAEQHMPADGTVSISVDRPEDALLRIRFHDTGSGIAPEDLTHIFDPFFTTRKAGTGLGLSIVKNTVENHGGAIRIFNNDPPPGITVEICMPLAGVIQ